ncbi:Fic family protein [Methylibium sp.]|uniref:Fic family protein n=1 Tax=Methylibium sp. TaxID=2067992 RepID=UPI0038F5FAE0
MFVYVHPYFDGNGRMGRFLMNAMLASGGYPWTVVPLAMRDRYMAALESASVNQDVGPRSQTCWRNWSSSDSASRPDPATGQPGSQPLSRAAHRAQPTLRRRRTPRTNR